MAMLHQRAEPAATSLAGVEASHAFFAPCLAGGGAKLLWVAHVDAEARCIHLSGHERAGDGSVPASQILKDAADLSSAGLILAQAPSANDALDATDTQRLAAAAEAFDCVLLDHLLVTRTDCRSMRRMGLL